MTRGSNDAIVSSKYWEPFDRMTKASEEASDHIISSGQISTSALDYPRSRGEKLSSPSWYKPRRLLLSLEISAESLCTGSGADAYANAVVHLNRIPVTKGQENLFC